MCHPEGTPEGSRNYPYFTWNGFLILRFRNDKQLKKNKKIDSSLHSESLFSAFWFWTISEESVRFSPHDHVILNRKIEDLYANAIRIWLCL